MSFHMPLLRGWPVHDVGRIPEAFLEIGIACAEPLGATGDNPQRRSLGNREQSGLREHG